MKLDEGHLRQFPLAMLSWLITGATLLPFLLLTGYWVTYWLDQQQQNERRRLTQSAEALARAVDRQLRGHLDTAQVLAMSRQLQSGDIPSLEDLARDAAAGVGGDYVLTDESNQQIVNTRSPRGAPLPRSAAPYGLLRVRETGKPEFTDLIFGAVAQQHLFAARLPVEVKGTSRYVLAYVPRADAILGVVTDNYVPAGWFALVMDGNGRIVARSAAHEEFYGKLASPDFLKQVKGESGFVEGVDLEGRPSFMAFRSSELNGWRAIVWAPKNLITSPIEQAKGWALGILLLTLIASALTAWLLGQVYHEAVQRLASAARALGEGQPVKFKPTRVQELNIAGAALADAARSIADREQALRVSEERFSTVFRLAPVAMAIATISDGRQVAVNEARLRLTGHAPEEIIGKTPQQIGFYVDHEKDYHRLRRGMAESGEVVAQEFELLRKNGDRYTGLISAAPILLNGVPHLLAIIVDITDRKRSEEHTKLLLREVNHRSKNLLAVAQAVASQTARSSEPAEFVARFGERMRSLAASHDLVVSAEWRGVEVRDLVQTQLGHFKDLMGKRITMVGAPLKITASAAQGIGMALHELATNSAKYGALSTSNGRVEVTWGVRSADGKAHFEISWHETGGPPVSTPTRRGFGRTVIVDLAQSAVGGEARLEFHETGIVWELKGPSELICEEEAKTA